MIKRYARQLLFVFQWMLLTAMVTAATLENAWAGRNHSSTTASTSQDTLRNVGGKIIDSVTHAPIPFVTLAFYKNDKIIMTIASDETGVFLTSVQSPRPKVLVSAIGYKDRTLYLEPGVTNLLRLSSADGVLPGVVVSSKSRNKPDASRLIKKVNEQLEQNYGDLSFDQVFKMSMISRNYDSTKGLMNDSMTLHFHKEQKMPVVKNWRHDTLLFDTAFFNFVRVPEFVSGNMAITPDIIRRGLVTGESRRKHFDFKLLAHYQDKEYGWVSLVSFKLHNSNDDFFGRGADYNGLGIVTGEMLVREDDYAVVQTKFRWNFNPGRLNAALEKDYRSPYWKGDKVSKIISGTLVFSSEYYYAKDLITGKYFISTLKGTCYQTGYQIENHRRVQLFYEYDANSAGVGNIEK